MFKRTITPTRTPDRFAYLWLALAAALLVFTDKPHDREGAPHTNGVTFLITRRVSSFELPLTSEECAEWLTKRFP
jgi:hypothetical protein